MVVGGAGDCAAGAVGNGIVRPGVLSTSIGTSGVVFVHSDTPQVDPQGRLHTFCHAVRGKWHMMGVTLAAGGSLQWFRNALCETVAALAKRRKIDVYDVLTEEAAVTPPGAEGLFFLPYLAGERTPHADPLARGAFVGLTLQAHARPPGARDHGRRHLLAARLPGDHRGARRRREADSRVRRRREEHVLAADAGRRARQDGRLDGGRRRPGLRRRPAGGRRRRRVQEHRRSLRRDGEDDGPDSSQRRRPQRYYDKAFPIYQQLYRRCATIFAAIAELG